MCVHINYLLDRSRLFDWWWCWLLCHCNILRTSTLPLGLFLRQFEGLLQILFKLFIVDLGRARVGG